MTRPVNYILDADIKGFFDNVDHKWLIKFLENDIEDKNFIRYIVRFLKSGIMEKEIILNKINTYSTGVHFSTLSCQPMNRCLNYNPKYEKNRFCVQIKWYNLFDDILEYKNNLLIK